MPAERLPDELPHQTASRAAATPATIRSAGHLAASRSANSIQRRTTRTYWPYPQSQSFSRGYGSVLPTSLIHIVLSTRGCSPWRPAAVMSTAKLVCWYRFLRFSRANGYAPDLPKSGRLCQISNPIADQFDSRVIEPVKKKRELFPGQPLTSLSSHASPPRTPSLGSGKLTGFPFGRRGYLRIATPSPRSNGLRRLLRTD